jgi:hypothetical protein
MCPYFQRWFGIFLIIIALLGCQQEAPQRAAQPKTVSATPGEHAQTTPASLSAAADQNAAQVGAERKLIKQGELAFPSANLAETRAAMNAAVQTARGYIANEQESRENQRLEQRLVIRVPAENFDALVAAIAKGVANFDRKQINVTDVTEEYLDLDARLRVKKETEDRYRELLAQAKTVEEMLAIEKQSGELRAEIESVEGRLQYLQHAVAYSTLTVTFYEPLSTSEAFGTKLRQSLRNGWELFMLFSLAVVTVWPFWILLAFILYGIRLLRRRRSKKSQPPAR